ncbi:ABC transporter ATP-binding protein [Amorphus coralli]|uniref:ABC transporter ATP-binding protein n=1 Tax=Amorphus coralli TaxID=340680 RepID=UPI000476EED6|nr:dipeptide ABC transporter ATP-binding protein [Amorphus coralli]
MALLDIDRLSLSIGAQPILDDVSLTVRAGETVGIVGESGSGKSMTALSVMRLLPAGARTSGSIRLDGEDLMTRSERAMCGIRGRKIGLVFQEPMTALNPVRTVGDQIAEAVRLHLPLGRAAVDARVATLLKRVGLADQGVGPDRYPHQLSGGQRQRVVIAIAIAADPKLLIADEPTTALDVTVQAQILALLRDVAAAEGAALVLITHDLAVVADMADRIAVMKDGRIVEEAAPLALFRAPKSAETRRLIAATTATPRPVPAPKADAPLLVEAERVARAYPLPRARLFGPRREARVLDAVSVSVRAGESAGLVGESGSGKSTLARTILALDRPDGGTVRFRGSDLFAMTASELRSVRPEIQAVFQDPYGSFDPRHTVGRIVGEPLHLLGSACAPDERRRRIVDALDHVGLAEADAARYPHQFSGGQRQRIAIARAIVTRPALVVADEPVSALDVSLQAQVLDLLARLRLEMNLALLFISHDLSVVRAVTDRVYVMQSGSIVESGATNAVFSRPAHAYTRALLDAAPSLERALTRREAATVD